MADSVIIIPQTIIVRDFAAKLGLPVTAVAAELIKNGIMSSMNEEIDFDTAAIIAEDLGKSIAPQTEEQIMADTPATIDHFKEDANATLVARPPAVVVLGHVDHGKTSLLDAIRETNVTAGEAGGITQRIGAYQVVARDRKITFIDTPGHAAFGQMRTRGTKIADVAILVVAADDGVQPQTKEAIEIMNKAAVPFLVAITKTDKPDANPDKVKKELSEAGVLSEEWGGKVPFVNVSSKSKDGIQDLLEAVLLVADVDSSSLMVDPKRAAVGTIIESHVDPQQGPIASVLVQTGTLRTGDELVVGQVWGKVRSMKNDRGEIIKEASPSTPVQILGLKAAPQVGDVVRVAPDEIQALKKKTKSHHLDQHTRTVVSRTANVMTKKDDGDDEEEKPEVNKLLLILKTDTLGSAEAILESLKKFHTEEVSVEVVQRGLGIISEADVMRAETAKAAVYGFHVPISPKADQLANGKEITVKTFDVIYDLLDEVKKNLEVLLPELKEVKEIGRLKVLAVFRNENTFQVFGGKVLDGEVRLGADGNIMRAGKPITSGRVTQLQENKQNVKEVAAGKECGLKFESKPLVQVGDELVVTVTEIKQRTLEV